eukprot:3334143-Pleurochrysis_carterae.AAC.1
MKPPVPQLNLGSRLLWVVKPLREVIAKAFLTAINEICLYKRNRGLQRMTTTHEPIVQGKVGASHWHDGACVHNGGRAQW